MTYARTLLLISLLSALVGVLAGCSSGEFAPLLELVGLGSLASSDTATPTAAATTTPKPIPTPEPGPVSDLIDSAVAATGLGQAEFLEVGAGDWVGLVVMVAAGILGFALGGWLLKIILQRGARRTATDLDDAILELTAPLLRWLIVVLFLQFAASQLSFRNAYMRDLLDALFFVLYWGIAVILGWRLLAFAEARYVESLDQAEVQRLGPVLTLLQRAAQVLLVLFASNVLLSQFGINVTSIATSIGILGLALSLAAQDTIADAISGFAILLDRPFRVGDRIEIADLRTWGDVTDIGLRTTRIRTRDNRLVIVPNSTIGKNQVINYTFPDPQYRIETAVGLAYGTDIQGARAVMIDTVRRVPGVLPDRPVEALYEEMGEYTMSFLVRWWIESYEDTRRIYDRVHSALQVAFDEVGIETPPPTYELNISVQAPDE